MSRDWTLLRWIVVALESTTLEFATLEAATLEAVVLKAVVLKAVAAALEDNYTPLHNSNILFLALLLALYHHLHKCVVAYQPFSVLSLKT